MRGVEIIAVKGRGEKAKGEFKCPSVQVPGFSAV